MMEYKGYRAWLSYSDEDGVFVGRVFGINDVLAFHGSSVSELEEMFHQAIDNYLDMCAQIGKSPEKEYKGQFNVRVPSELHRAAAYYAMRENMSLNEFVVTALRDECARYEASEKG